ncbi:sulfatase [Tamlana carrageenivorans]|uniref:Sulfatase n=1 Tax=Pseudotamlana carrageenivorans TaxID=2069432 RepID=A0A2I7SK92_9FLAO|nr:sulfatase [Tamlana carrageenivorans]
MIKKFFLVFLVFAFFSCKSKETIVDTPKKKPNVLFILVDDLGYHDLGITGSNFYETPHVDKLAVEGVMFTNGYAASRVCSPSRASIMTGKFTARHGITDWIGAKAGTDWRLRNRHDKLLPANYVMQLPQEDITIAEAFKNEGYKTFFAGKWHLGDKGSYPEDHGFDINKGGFHRGGPSGGFFAPFGNPKLKNKQKGENLTMRLANETADFITQHKDSSFFAFLSFYAVHAPIQTTQAKWAKYRTKADSIGLAKTGYTMERILPIRTVQDNPVYAGLVETMDDAVGVVLKALKDNGLEDHTIVVFTSDNGGVASGDNYATSNLPLRGGKGYQWEGGIKEPFFIKVPWLKNSIKTSEVPVVSTDLYPTLLDLSNLLLIPEQHMDGISLKPLLEGKKIDEKRSLYWHYPHYGNQGGEPSSIIQKEGWKLIHYWEDGREELFKLPSEESDSQNLIAQHTEIAKKLRKELMMWLEEVNALIPVTDTEFDVAKREKYLQNIKNQKLPNLEKQRLEVLSPNFKPNEDWWGSQLTVD